MLETLIMLIGVVCGFYLLKLREHTKVKLLMINNKAQVIIVIAIIFIMGINLGSMHNFNEKIWNLGYQSILFAVIPTIFSIILVYILTKIFSLKNKY